MRNYLAFLLLAACGDNLPGTVDARSIDGAPADAAITRIEVQVVFQDSSPAPNIDVVFHDAAGAVVTTAKTDAAGKATIDRMPSVKMVTVLGFDTANMKRELSTTMGVEPGDTLGFFLNYGGANPQPPQPFTAELAVTFPANPPGGATTFRLDLMCESVGTGGTSFTHTMLNDCRRENSNAIDAVVVAQNGGTNTGFAVMPNLTLAASGPTTVNFPGGWRTDWRNLTVDYTSSPAGATDARTFFQVRIGGGNRYIPYVSQAATLTPGSTTSRMYTFANGIGIGTSHSIEVYYGPTMPRASAFFAKGSAFAAAAPVDLGARLLPPVTGITVEDAMTARPKLTWTRAGTHEKAASGFAYAEWPGTETGSWGILFPPDLATPSVTVPALPDALAAFRPPMDGSFGATTKLVNFQWASYRATYTAAKAPFQPFTGTDYEELTTRYPGF